MGKYYKNQKILERALKFQKIICLCVLACLISMTAGIHKVFAVTDTQTVSGVTFTVATDKDDYTLGELADITLTIQNNNPYDVDISEFKLELPQWMQLEEGFLHQTVPAEETVTLNTTMNFTFEDWKTVDINGQSIRVGVRALCDTIETGSTLQFQTIPKGSKEYNSYLKKLDNPNEIKRAEFLNISVRQKNGTMYSKLLKPAMVYIEVPKGWHESELQAIYISAGVDEQFQENFVTIDGVRYLCFETDHFSPYIIANTFTPALLKTGDISFDNYYIALSLIAALLITALFIRHKKRLSICSFILVAQLFLVPVYNNVSATDGPVVNLKMSISNLVFNIKIMISGKPEYKVPENIRVNLRKNILEIKMDSVPKCWKGIIVFEDKGGYDNHQQKFRYRDMCRVKNSYRYIMSTDDLQRGTYDISIYDNSNKFLFVKNDVVLN